MARPRLMTDHSLDTLGNALSNMHHLQFVAPLSANVTVDPVFSGRVAHLNAAGELELGLPDTVGACHMPLFLWNNSDDLDVRRDGGDPATDVSAWAHATPSGGMKCLVAVGAWELETTEFEPEATAGVYVPGDGLTATPSNSNAVTGGRITKGTAYTDPLCGVVSRGVRLNSFRRSVLAFWPVWLPRQA